MFSINDELRNCLTCQYDLDKAALCAAMLCGQHIIKLFKFKIYRRIVGLSLVPNADQRPKSILVSDIKSKPPKFRTIKLLNLELNKFAKLLKAYVLFRQPPFCMDFDERSTKRGGHIRKLSPLCNFDKNKNQ